MTWHRLFVAFAVFGGWCAAAFGAALLWLIAVDLKTRQIRRARDKPIKGDETMLRIERSEWMP